MTVNPSAVTPTSQPVVVFDVETVAFRENRILDVEYTRQFPGAGAFAQVGLRLKLAGIESVTADEYLAHPRTNATTAVFSVEMTPYTDTLLNLPGIVPAVSLSLESPVMAVAYYRSVRQLSARYRHMFLWPGVSSRVTGGATFHPVSWPYPDWTPLRSCTPWAERKLLILVSSNKRAFARPRPLIDPFEPISSARRVKAAIRVALLRVADPWFRSELYVSRLRAISYFAQDDGFDLYGRGWENAGATLPKHTAEAVARCYQGEIPPLDKTSVMSDYKFSLCFENTSFPGYITEKIFDCFVAGCIPIYWGAPDVAQAIPESTFIDATSFRGFREMRDFIRSMTTSQGQSYLDAARAFLNSPDAARYHEDRFVADVTDALLESLGTALADD